MVLYSQTEVQVPAMLLSLKLNMELYLNEQMLCP